ncbi:hypothetical protein MTO96_008479 [Rhipicephalus appendiculatus]
MTTSRGEGHRERLATGELDFPAATSTNFMLPARPHVGSACWSSWRLPGSPAILHHRPPAGSCQGLKLPPPNVF